MITTLVFKKMTIIDKNLAEKIAENLAKRSPKIGKIAENWRKSLKICVNSPKLAKIAEMITSIPDPMKSNEIQ
jgi:predicted glycosyltransferase